MKLLIIRHGDPDYTTDSLTPKGVPDSSGKSSGIPSLTMEGIPTDPIYQKYTDGDCIRQFLFLFASRECYSADVNQCIENLAFYETFEAWIRKNNEDGRLPELEGCDAISLEVLTGGYAFDVDTNTARYQMQLRLLYN